MFGSRLRSPSRLLMSITALAVEAVDVHDCAHRDHEAIDPQPEYRAQRRVIRVSNIQATKLSRSGGQALSRHGEVQDDTLMPPGWRRSHDWRSMESRRRTRGTPYRAG